MKTIEERVQILEAEIKSLKDAFLQSQSNQAITQGTVDESHNKIPQVDKNTSDISDTTNGLVDLADITDDNVTGLTDLADIVAELDERVTALEEK